MKETVKYIIKKLLIFINRITIFKGERVLFIEWNSTIYTIVNKCLFRYKIFFLNDKYYEIPWRYFSKEEYVNLKPHICSLKYKAHDYLISHGIEYVVFDKFQKSDLWVSLILQTAKNLKIKLIYMDHGTTGEFFDFINYNLLDLVDVYYATNSDLKMYYHEDAKRYKLNTVVKEWDRPRVKKRKKSFNFIMVATRFHEGELHASGFPDTLKYKHHKKLAEALNSINKGVEVIWKSLVVQEVYEVDPVLYWIRDNCDNIKIEMKNNFNKLIRRCKVLIVDCISTPFYEAMDIGVPVYALIYKKGNKVREEVLHKFVAQIILYDDIELGIKELLFRLDRLHYQQLPKIEHKVDRFGL